MIEPVDSNKETTEETLDSHISFMYSVAQVHSTIPRQATMTSKNNTDDTRDDIENFSCRSFEWDAGIVELRDQYICKDASRLRKPTTIPFMNNIGKALKKPWRRSKKASDKVPLISKRNLVDWDVIPTYTRAKILHGTMGKTDRIKDV